MAKHKDPSSAIIATTCVLALVAMAFLIGWSASRSYRSPSWKDIEDSDQTKFGPMLQGPATIPSPEGKGVQAAPDATKMAEMQNGEAAMRAQLIAEIHAADADERAILDRLVTVVGGYALLIGLATFGAVKLTSEQARGQLATVDAEVKRLRDSMSGEVLELRNLKDGLRTLLFDLERTVPEETDWNARESYERLTPSQIQHLLINEATIAALPIFLSSQSTENIEVMARLYRALANFYLGRYQKERRPEDAERAHAYARKSPENVSPADAYRLRGSIFLAEYWILRSQDNAPTDVSTTLLNQLLTDAESNLRVAAAKKKNDAGATCNLALVSLYREQVDDGLRLLQEGIRNRDQYSDLEMRKYLPAMYINLACVKARQGDSAEENADLELAEIRRNEALTTVKVGLDYLRKRGVFAGVERMWREIDRELRPDRGDFRRMGQQRVDRLRSMIGPSAGANMQEH